jgi:hypothetical protein
MFLPDAVAILQHGFIVTETSFGLAAFAFPL